MFVLTFPLLLMTYLGVTVAYTQSHFTRDVQLDNKQITEHSDIVLDLEPVTQCARYCHNTPTCLSFVHNKNNEACHLLSHIPVDSEGSISESGSEVYRKRDDQGACPIPTTITRGTVLHIDGQREGSKAQFVCDDYFFPTTEDGVCNSEGAWAGLDSACVSMNEPYYISAKGKIYPGMCVVVMATPTKSNKVRFRLQRSTSDYNFIIVAHFADSRITRNSKANGEFETGFDDTPYWPFVVNQEFNLTVCAEENMYRVYVDNKEMFTFVYRHPLSEIEHAVLSNDVVMRRFRFVG